MIGPNSPLRHLKISNYVMDASKEFWKRMETDSSLSVLEFTMKQQHGDLLFFAPVSSNPFIEIIAPNRSFDYFRLSVKCKELLQTLRECVTILQTILLSKDKGLFANLPNEVMFNIFRHYTQSKFNSTQLAALFDMASKHEWIFENANTREKLRQLWHLIKPK